MIQWYEGKVRVGPGDGCGISGSGLVGLDARPWINPNDDIGNKYM